MSFLKSIFRAQVWIQPFEFLFERVLAYTAALAMFTMMLVTLVDVIGRDLFSAPLPGGFEVTELLLASLIFLGLPMVTAEGSHVDVDIMDSTIPAFLKPLQDIAICMVNLVAFAALSWMMWKLAIRTYEYEDTTAILQIPFAGLVFLMAVCCSLSTWSLMLMLVFKRGRKLFGHDHSGAAVKEVE